MMNAELRDELARAFATGGAPAALELARSKGLIRAGSELNDLELELIAGGGDKLVAGIGAGAAAGLGGTFGALGAAFAK